MSQETPSIRCPHMGAIDARAIVPVRDAHGGLTMYSRGRPTHYLLAGEWYVAAPRPHAPQLPESPGRAGSATAVRALTGNRIS